ncbi:MAG: dihydroorotate dehydrogenase electron transfer subunit [Candidatus Omnitrophota bacterium]
MFRERCKVLENKKVAPGHFVLKARSPRIAKNARPGRFVQILCSESMDPLLPRPFSFLTADSKDFSILYHVVGKGTQFLSEKRKGENLWVLGPCGNGFGLSLRGHAVPEAISTHRLLRRSLRRPPRNDIVLVGGGVGIPPLYHLALEWTQKRKIPKEGIHVFLGARNKSLLLCEKDFKKLGVGLHLSTDDGSRGQKGFITESLEDFIMATDPAKTSVYTCGPTPMLKAVSAIARKYEIPCEVSVEVPMACGFGACLGCAIRVKDKFAIACCEGPVFRGDEIQWD